MYNLLNEPIIRIRTHAGKTDELSLPGVLAALTRDEIAAFPGLRPHQVPAWHMFLVQLAALALHRSGKTDLPEEAEMWVGLLHALTPDYGDDEPWHLIVEDRAKPAFMQAPEPNTSAYSDTLTAPDKLDMLATAKNHDVKQSIALNARLDEWVFALISTQTMNGNNSPQYMGIVRMNKGHSSRVCFTLTPLKNENTTVSFGERFTWDLRRMLHNRDRLQQEWSGPDYEPERGKELLWLYPWDSDEKIRVSALDVWFIEICRRVRLALKSDAIVALTRTNASNRTDGANLKGVTKDFWAPTNVVKSSSLTLSERDFGYRNILRFLYSPEWQLPLSVDLEGEDETAALEWLFQAEAFARGQDVTYGFKQRKLLLPAVIVGMTANEAGRKELGKLSALLMKDVSFIAEVMKWAIRNFLKEGRVAKAESEPELRVEDEEDADGKAKGKVGGKVKGKRKENGNKLSDRAPVLFEERMNIEADRIFFDRLWQRVEARRNDKERGDGENTGLHAAERAFRKELLSIASKLLEEAVDSLPCPAAYRHRARVRAEGLFFGSVYKNYPELKQQAEEAAEDAV